MLYIYVVDAASIISDTVSLLQSTVLKHRRTQSTGPSQYSLILHSGFFMEKALLYPPPYGRGIWSNGVIDPSVWFLSHLRGGCTVCPCPAAISGEGCIA